MKKYKYISKPKQGEFFSDFLFVVNGINTHQLNLGPFKSFKSFVENPFKFFLVR